jgi:DNA polymerase-3 subunit delta
MARRLGLQPWLPRRLLAQAQNFSMADLEAAHQLLVETDRSIKTGQMEDVLALDLLVVDLTRD